MWPFSKKEKGETKGEKGEEEKLGEKETQSSGPECSICGKPGADKKYGGQWWHKKCLRKFRKKAKHMV